MSLDQAMADGATLVNENRHTNGDTSKPASNVAATQRFERGDLEAGFAEAGVIVESEHRVPMAHQGYIEPHACTATVNEDGKSTVWCCTQRHFDARSLTAQVLDESVGNIKVIPSEIGGGLGGKTTIYLDRRTHRTYGCNPADVLRAEPVSLDLRGSRVDVRNCAVTINGGGRTVQQAPPLCTSLGCSRSH